MGKRTGRLRFRETPITPRAVPRAGEWNAPNPLRADRQCNQTHIELTRPRSLRRRTLLQTFGGLRYPYLGPDVPDFALLSRKQAQNCGSGVALSRRDFLRRRLLGPEPNSAPGSPLWVKWLRHLWDYDWGEVHATSPALAVASASVGLFVALCVGAWNFLELSPEGKDYIQAAADFLQAGMGLSAIAAVLFIVTGVLAVTGTCTPNACCANATFWFPPCSAAFSFI